MNEGGMTFKAEVIADLDGDNKVTDATVVYDLGDGAFGIDVNITSDNMKDITDTVKQSIKNGLSYSHIHSSNG